VWGWTFWLGSGFFSPFLVVQTLILLPARNFSEIPTALTSADAERALENSVPANLCSFLEIRHTFFPEQSGCTQLK
jgi:hypothetical protein